MSPNLNPIIDIQGLTKEYKYKIVVDNIHLKIEDSCFALLGLNGAGKTTTILMLLGLVKPNKGTASILGKDIIKSYNEICNKVGFLPEDVGFFPYLTGREHLELIIRLRGNTLNTEENTQYYLKWSGIEKEYWDRRTRTYSRGMKQRLGLAQAFAGNPKVVFLDEPLSNIDPLGRDDLINKIREKRKEGTTIIISSHIILEIEQLADSLAIIDKGKIIRSGTFFELTQSIGLNEYEINRINNTEEISLKVLNDILVAEEDLIIDKPTILSEKLIFRTKNPEKISNLIKKYEDFHFMPISGTLNKLYRKFIEGNKR